MHINSLDELSFDSGGLDHKTQYAFLNQQCSLSRLAVKKIDASLVDESATINRLMVFRTLNNEQLLAQKLPNLVELHLHDASRRADFTFFENLSAIQSLYIGYCSHLTSFPKLKNPENVRHIDLPSCYNFADIDSLLPFVNLERLWITSFDKPLKFKAADLDRLKQLSKLKVVYTNGWEKSELPKVEKIYRDTGWVNSAL